MTQRQGWTLVTIGCIGGFILGWMLGSAYATRRQEERLDSIEATMVVRPTPTFPVTFVIIDPTPRQVPTMTPTATETPQRDILPVSTATATPVPSVTPQSTPTVTVWVPDPATATPTPRMVQRGP